MTVPNSTAPLSPVRLANDLARRFRLRNGAQVLDIGSDKGVLVARLRACGVTAYGLFDGPAAPRDPLAIGAEGNDVPEIQPAVLHQSLPFLAQSFDSVLLRDSEAYRHSLSSPEACTATANLLASLKPGRFLVCCGPCSLNSIDDHLSNFPGASQRITLGSGGIGGMLSRLLGRGSELPAIQFTIPAEPISRLEWHRHARKAVLSAKQPAA